MARVALYCARFHGEDFGVDPLGLGYLASFLVHHGIVAEDEVRIVDSLDDAVAFAPDIVGVSAVSQVLADARSFAAACRRATGCRTVIGGYHISCVPHLLPSEFDLGVIGEGELTFADIVGAHASGDLDLPTVAAIPGLTYRSADTGAVVQTPPRAHIADIDSLPWPHRHRPRAREQGVFTSRGCPYRCSYCASHTFWGDHVRLRGAAAVVEEISHIVEDRAPREVVILDDLWMANKRRFREIVSGLEERGVPERVTFRGFCRSNIVHEEDLLLFKRMNYRVVRFGAETGSDRLLRRIKGDGISVADHQRVIDLCEAHGLRCGASFMFGVPGETREDLAATVHFLRKNRDRCQIMGFYLFNPIPGTRMWSDLEARGEVGDDLDFERLQLDLLKPGFSWERILYFNSASIPLDEFRVMVEDIRDEFVDRRARAGPGLAGRSRRAVQAVLRRARRLLG